MDQEIEITQTNQKVVATKITGDDCVPAGNVSWEGEVVDIVWGENKTIFGTHIYGVIYGKDLKSGALHQAQAILNIVDQNHLELMSDGGSTTLVFDRTVD